MVNLPLLNAGCIIIGRNEGERLIRCLNSVCEQFAIVVYVDSGSTDNSVESAVAAGAKVVELDMSLPFTAARARNTGLNFLIQQMPSIEFVQFIDGDCELVSSWPHVALNFLEAHPEFAIVCGRRRERNPDSSIFNALCDHEWNTPIGEASACGGDALMRISALIEINAYNSNLIAGEEPEMCHRLRMSGWKIYRLDEEMTLHDAAIFSFAQWWKRASRGGYAYFRVYIMHLSSPASIWKKNVIRSSFWGLVVPLIVLVSSFLGYYFIATLFVLLYFFLFLKIYIKSANVSKSIRFYYSLLMIVVKFAEIQGGLIALLDVISNKQVKIMEYK